VSGTIDTAVAPDGIVSLAGSVWVATDVGPQLQQIDASTSTVVGTFQIADQEQIDANQLIGIGDGALWFPLFDRGTVLKVAIPSAAATSPATATPSATATTSPVTASPTVSATPTV
jgi:hypothetical protein